VVGGKLSRRFSCGRVRVVIVVLIAMGACLFVAAPVSAQPVEIGTFSFTSDPGDYVGGGGSYSYDAAAGDSLTTYGPAGGPSVFLTVYGANGDWWYLYLAAPAGETLDPGTYSGATRTGEGGTPSLDFYGNERGCTSITGSFTINAIEWFPNGYLKTLDATFEQHCDGAEPAARGQVDIANPPQPPAQELALTVATEGTAQTVSGNARLNGTVTCTKAAEVFVSGAVVQNNKETITRGYYARQVACTPGAPAPWAATAIPSGGEAFQKGDAEVTSEASAYDSYYDTYVTVSDITVVKLIKSRG
jgi:hypothetical protein